MYKIKIFSVGKTKEVWLEEAYSEYIKRLSSSVSLNFHFVKTDLQLETLAFKEPHFICLDPQGSQMTSELFSSFLLQNLEKRGCQLCFIIGGAKGLSPSLKQKADFLISLSSMTFTHQITRLILIEQIYRALEIQKGSSYHK